MFARVRSFPMLSIALAAAWIAMSACPARGAAIGVSPLSLELTTDQPTRALEITNPSQETVHVQVRVFAWSGGGVDERYDVNREVALSPPMFELQPGQKQIVRLSATPAGDREAAYRIFVDQVTPEAAQAVGVAMPVRLALPLFVRAAKGGRGLLTWTVEDGPGGRFLVAGNSGGRRMRLTALEVETESGTRTLAVGLAGYVLAQDSRAWRIPPDIRIVRGVRAISEDGPIRAELRPD